VAPHDAKGSGISHHRDQSLQLEIIAGSQPNLNWRNDVDEQQLALNSSNLNNQTLAGRQESDDQDPLQITLE